MGDSSSKDLVYRIVSTASGDGFKKTAADADEAKAKLEGAGRAADEAGGKRVSVKTDTNAEETGQKLKNAGKDADKAGQDASNSGGGWGGLAAKISLITAGVGVLGPALAALPAALAGVGAGAGVLTLGLGGIATAVKDYGTASNAAGISSAQLAATAFSNAIAIRNAQQAIAQARIQANQQAASSADSLISAEERLGNAEQSEQNAVVALNQARQDQARSIIQANEAAATAALDVKSAQLAVVEAQKQQIATDQSLTATALDKEKAQLAVQQAQNSLNNITERAKEAQQDADKANRDGVENSPRVITAKQAEANAAQSVGDAQRALAAAQRQAAASQAASARQIAQAVQNLADTQKQQALTAAASAAQAGAAFNQFGKDMSKLTPMGQQIVHTILGMRGELDKLKATSQNAIGPGVLVFLSGLQAMGPTANTALQQMGTAIGGVFTQLGKLMQSPAFQKDLGAVFHEAAGFVTQFGTGFSQMVQGVTAAGAKAAPIVQGLGSGIQQILGQGLPALFSGLASGGSGAGQALSSLGGIISDLMGPVGTLVGQIASSLGPVLTALRPVIGQLATILAQNLVPVFHALSPLLVLGAQLLQALMPIISPLITLAGQLATILLQALVPALQPLIPVIQQAAQTIGAQLLQAITQLMPGFVQMINACVQLLPALVPLIPMITQLVTLVIQTQVPFLQLQAAITTVIASAIKPLLGFIVQFQPLFGPAIGALRDMTSWFSGLGNAAQTGAGWVEQHIGDLVNWVSGLPSKLATAAKGAWDWITGPFKDAINQIIRWWDNLSFTTPSFHIPGTDVDVGGVTIGMPHIPLLAAGGTALSDGLAVVGDAGPELLQMKAGARIYSNSDSRALLSGAGSHQLPDHFTAEITMKLPSGQIIDKQLVEFQRQGGVSQAIRVGALAALGTGAR